MDYTSSLFASSPTDKNSPIFVDADQPNRRVTWNDYASVVKRAAVGLSKIGVTNGQCVALWSRNDIYYHILGDGIVAAGAVFSGLASFMTRNEMTRLLHAADVSWLVAEPDLLDEALLAAKDVGIDTSHVLAFDPPGLPEYSGAQVGFSQVLANDEDTRKPYNGIDSRQPETCFRLLTSGTTGVPKAAEISHAAQMARIRSPIPSWKGHPSEVRWLQVVGMYHLTSLYASNSAVIGDHTTYVTARPDPRSIIDNIELHSITSTLLPPHIMESITAAIKAGYKSRNALASLRAISVVGTIARKDSLTEFKALLPSHAILQTPYGSTEMGIISMVYPNMPFIPGFIGIPAPGVEMQVINPDTLKSVSPDTQGELCVRGPALFSTYLNNPTATLSSMLPDPTGSWYRTGDKGYFSTAHQQYALTGRYKEIFKVRYEEVSPEEVETELLKYPGIKDAAVTSTVARDNEKDCECVAYVVADSGVEAHDILEFLKGKLSRHKLPSGGVFFCAIIPRNRLGKVLRGELGKMEVQGRSVRYLEVDGLKNGEKHSALSGVSLDRF